jgi:hypothetical protein
MSLPTKNSIENSKIVANYNTQEKEFLATNSYTLNGGISNDINDR